MAALLVVASVTASRITTAAFAPTTTEVAKSFGQTPSTFVIQSRPYPGIPRNTFEAGICVDAYLTASSLQGSGPIGPGFTVEKS